ncbi:MAG: Chromosomal replication initiator protein DnaA [Alphaproteobacteria bacterium MarineAlpha6_Bin4]|nr:MAG: Chromosomal replication initiator protein DnaA [Alphaproteobacteria bacterium MarineAlpha6_Bin5]PPR37708.1 MAG: Chromosomal replication initiator protein DnaA [Alphaproteobacteria bacterium MarineAlpha6_Bin4]|tara:strand:- start:12647 stop:14023 length:1377 start_codon:yes stop_codon:yes gene_type:complete
MSDLKKNINSDEIIWSSIKLQLKDIYGDAEYSNWLKLLTFSKVEKDIIKFYAPTKFMCDWILSHYGKKILSFWREKDKSIKDISVFVYNENDKNSDNDDQTKTNKNFTKKIPNSSKNDLENNLDPRFTFKDFVVGKSNELAFSACRRVADSEDVPFNPLFLYGGVGLGKTHLMHAIAWQRMKLNPKLKILYLSAEKFMYEFIKALRLKNTVAFKEQFRSVNLLMIDDVQFIIGKESTQEEFFHTFNALADQNRQMVISADKSPSDLEGLEERLRSRLGWGLVADIHPTTYELRLSIIEAKIERYNIDLSKDVIEFLAHKITSSVRELEGALTRLAAHVTLVGRSVNLEIAEDLLQDLLRASDRRTTIDQIQKKVAEHFNVKVSDMHSSRRSRAVARPRQIAMFLAKNLTSRSLPEIGRKFGGRDHTTVIHAIKKVQELTKNDSSLSEDIEILTRSLQS